MKILTDLLGEKFGRLDVIEQAGRERWGNTLWLCRCKCGNVTMVTGSHLRSGNTQSCGCLNNEIITKHGHRTKNEKSKTYESWAKIIQRCTNTNNKDYHRYGGRGITICAGWLESFENFLKDMGKSPTKDHSINRIDNDKGYYKENCEWATSEKQARNRRNNLFVTHDGNTRLLIELCEEYNMPYRVVWERIYKLDWSTEKSLTTPTRERRGKQ
jgi:hypothetical protein